MCGWIHTLCRYLLISAQKNIRSKNTPAKTLSTLESSLDLSPRSGIFCCDSFIQNCRSEGNLDDVWLIQWRFGTWHPGPEEFFLFPDDLFGNGLWHWVHFLLWFSHVSENVLVSEIFFEFGYHKNGQPYEKYPRMMTWMIIGWYIRIFRYNGNTKNIFWTQIYPTQSEEIYRSFSDMPITKNKSIRRKDPQRLDCFW